MLRYGWIACTVLCWALAGCGKAEESATAALERQQQAARAEAEAGPASDNGPTAIEAVVLIKDATLDGRCAFSDPADTWPGASIASVKVLGVDGNVKGHGRMLWDQAGFEVAAERGTPPDGSEFAGDACTDAYNLGCDGQTVFELVGGDGRVQKIREGDKVIVHIRGRQACGEEVVDEIEGAICHDPAAAASGRLESCTSKVRMIEARSDDYGPDRVGGTITYLATP